jgi:hypothetical protein
MAGHRLISGSFECGPCCYKADSPPVETKAPAAGVTDPTDWRHPENRYVTSGGRRDERGEQSDRPRSRDESPERANRRDRSVGYPCPSAVDATSQHRNLTSRDGYLVTVLEAHDGRAVRANLKLDGAG